MKEEIEIRNETDKEIIVSACRSKLSGILYIEVGGSHKPVKIAPNDYAFLKVNQIPH